MVDAHFMQVAIHLNVCFKSLQNERDSKPLCCSWPTTMPGAIPTSFENFTIADLLYALQSRKPENAFLGISSYSANSFASASFDSSRPLAPSRKNSFFP